MIASFRSSIKHTEYLSEVILKHCRFVQMMMLEGSKYAV